MVAKKTTPAYDFDGWDAEAEDAAIRAIAASAKPQHIIVENRLVARFSDGEIVEVPLRMTLAQIEDVAAKMETDAPGEQIELVLRVFGDDATADKLRERDMHEVNAIGGLFVETFNKIHAVSLGE